MDAQKVIDEVLAGRSLGQVIREATQVNQVKVPWVRNRGVPAGTAAKGHLECPCGNAPETAFSPATGDILCHCGRVYSWNGWLRRDVGEQVLVAGTSARQVTEAAASPWYEGPHKERVFAAMRKLGAEVDHYYAEARRLSPSYGQTAVGSAAFDLQLKAMNLEEFLRGVRNGLSPEESGDAAKAFSRGAIQKHNMQRRDASWKRWEGSGDTFIDRAVRLIRDAADAR